MPTDAVCRRRPVLEGRRERAWRPAHRRSARRELLDRKGREAGEAASGRAAAPRAPTPHERCSLRARCVALSRCVRLGVLHCGAFTVLRYLGPPMAQNAPTSRISHRPLHDDRRGRFDNMALLHCKIARDSPFAHLSGICLVPTARTIMVWSMCFRVRPPIAQSAGLLSLVSLVAHTFAGECVSPHSAHGYLTRFSIAALGRRAPGICESPARRL